MWAGGGKPVVLVGHSFGALLLLAYTQRFPKHVAGLVMLEPISLSTWSECSKSIIGELEIGAMLSRRGAWLAEFGVVRAALMLLFMAGQRWSQQIGRRAAGPGRGDARTADWRGEQAAAGIVAGDCGAMEPSAELPRDGRHAWKRCLRVLRMRAIRCCLRRCRSLFSPLPRRRRMNCASGMAG